MPAGIFSFGVLLTNLAAAVLVFGSSLLHSGGVRCNIRKALLFVALVVGITMGLALAQKLIWPKSVLFFGPSTYAGESRFIKMPLSPHDIVRREKLLLRHVLAFDWFAPDLLSATEEKRMTTFDARSLAAIRGSGRAALAIWFVLLGASFYGFLRFRLYTRPIPLGLSLCLLFNLLLHSLYGDDLFLYSCNTCFLLLAFVALCTSEVRLSAFQNRAADLGLLILLALEIANNQRFVLEIVSITRW